MHPKYICISGKWRQVGGASSRQELKLNRTLLWKIQVFCPVRNICTMAGSCKYDGIRVQESFRWKNHMMAQQHKVIPFDK